jgi:hypothetical protein
MARSARRASRVGASRVAPRSSESVVGSDPLASAVIDRPPARDLEHPPWKRRVVAQLLEPGPGRHEGVLHHVAHVGARHPREDHGVDGALHPPVELGVRAAVPRARAHDEVHDVGSGWGRDRQRQDEGFHGLGPTAGRTSPPSVNTTQCQERPSARSARRFSKGALAR